MHFNPHELLLENEDIYPFITFTPSPGSSMEPGLNNGPCNTSSECDTFLEDIVQPDYLLYINLHISLHFFLSLILDL